MLSREDHTRGMPSGHSPSPVPRSVLGLVGPSGGGKSFLLELLRQEGAAVLEADAVYAGLVMPGSPLLAALAEEFGREIVSPDGRLDRAALGSRAFASPEARARLDALTHPPLRAALASRLTELAATGAAVAIEAAVLFEAGLDPLCTEIWYVDAPRAVRARRLRDARGWDEERTERLLDAQESLEQWRARCDRAVDGSLPEDALRTLAREWMCGRGR